MSESVSPHRVLDLPRKPENFRRMARAVIQIDRRMIRIGAGAPFTNLRLLNLFVICFKRSARRAPWAVYAGA